MYLTSLPKDAKSASDYAGSELEWSGGKKGGM